MHAPVWELQKQTEFPCNRQLRAAPSVFRLQTRGRTSVQAGLRTSERHCQFVRRGQLSLVVIPDYDVFIYRTTRSVQTNVVGACRLERDFAHGLWLGFLLYRNIRRPVLKFLASIFGDVLLSADWLSRGLVDVFRFLQAADGSSGIKRYGRHPERSDGRQLFKTQCKQW